MTSRYFTIEPTVEDRTMTRKQWKHAHREARIMCRMMHELPEFKRFKETTEQMYRDMLMYGAGVVTHRI